MAHAILGKRFMARSKPAWHGLGEVFAEDLKVSASEAVKKVAGDIEIHQFPLQYIDGDGKSVDLKKHFAIVRSATSDDSDPVLLGLRTDQWHSVSYVQLAKALDELSKTYKVETCGLINEGGLCFISFRGPDFSIRGDWCEDFFIANLSQTPGRAHTVFAAPVRVVCDNTNTMAESSSTISLSIPHSAKAEERIKLAGNLVAQFKSITAKSVEIFEKFAKVKITNDNLNLIFEAAWPDPRVPTELQLLNQALTSGDEDVVKKAFGDKFAQIVTIREKHEARIQRVRELRECGRERFEVFDPKKLRGTVWAAYNAVTEVADWRGDGKKAGIGSLYGNRAREKSNAFGASMEAAGLVLK